MIWKPLYTGSGCSHVGNLFRLQNANFTLVSIIWKLSNGNFENVSRLFPFFLNVSRGVTISYFVPQIWQSRFWFSIFDTFSGGHFVLNRESFFFVWLRPPQNEDLNVFIFFFQNDPYYNIWMHIFQEVYPFDSIFFATSRKIFPLPSSSAWTSFSMTRFLIG